MLPQSGFQLAICGERRKGSGQIGVERDAKLTFALSFMVPAKSR
jgi:hypothetical protein